MRTATLRYIALLGLVFLVACAPSVAAPRGSATEQPAAKPARTLVTTVRNEPPTLAAVPLGAHGTGFATYLTKRMFNADLAIINSDGDPEPYLAQALPKLGTDDWQVFPDGRMQTTYRLRQNLTWHDGSPLTAEDFTFSWQVYSSPALGTAKQLPFNLIDSVEAPDATTIVVKWKQPYPDADAPQSIGTGARALAPLPHSILASAFEQQAPDAFAGHPFWTQEYVGAGPFRLDGWDPGVALEASAFAGHVLGAPKISRIRVLFRSDGNAVLASMLSGDIDLAADVALPLGFVPEVLKGWGDGHGSAILFPNQWRAGVVQARPDIVGSQALLDARLRRGLAFAIDKEAVNQAVWAGLAIPADAPIAPDSALGKAANAAATKYPFDLRQSEQQMAAAGFSKGSDGVYSSPTLGRLAIDIMTNTSPNNEAEMTTVAGGWRQSGVDVSETVNPPALGRDNQARATFRGVFIASTNVGPQTFEIFSSGTIGRPDNRWVGSNRGGFSDPQYDQLLTSFTTTLDRPSRAQVLAQVTQILTDAEPAISLFFAPQPWVFINDLKGPNKAASNSNIAWDMHLWTIAESTNR